MSGKTRRSAGAIRAISGATSPSAFTKRDRAPRAADRLLDDLHVRQVRRSAAHLHAVPGEHPHAACLGLVADLGNKP